MKMKNGHKNRAPFAFIIAGTNSGVGKTVITLGIMEALRRRNIAIQPFKAGPDYIDAGLHSALLKRPSYNLDTWMMGTSNVKKTFYSASSGTGISVIEGVMGLFDGKDGLSDEGSTAHIAKLLNIPVVLVVNAEKMARSAAAVVEGFKGFDVGVDVKWVVFNRVASELHGVILKESIKDIRGVQCLGCIPKDGGLTLPERHLGLFARGELKGNVWQGFIKKAGEAIERHLDIEALLKPFLKIKAKAKREKTRRTPHHGERVRIAVARDTAFSFYYEENLDILRGLGGELIFFSPLRDRRLPEGTCGVYIGGGYPELYSKGLSSNRAMMREIKDMAINGMPIYAECGGLMYLSMAIKGLDGASYPMTGVFPLTARMLKRRKALGYRRIRALPGCPFLKKGGNIRGHEFHYSEIKERSGPSVKKSFTIKSVHDSAESGEGYLYKNALATYMHLHFASNPSFAKGFVRSCQQFKGRRGE